MSEMTNPTGSERTGGDAQQTQAGADTTLNNCEREPIHLPGSIQAHGALIAFAPGSGVVLHTSNNLQHWLGVDVPAGGTQLHLTDLMGPDGNTRVFQAMALLGRGGTRHQIIDLPARPQQGQSLALDGMVHIHQGIGFVEMQAAPTAKGMPEPMQSYAGVVEILRDATDQQDLVERLALSVKQMTNLDHVMVYKFDTDWNGEVIADAHQTGIESLLGLHYPATDIPPQARALYRSNLVRYIADVGYSPVAVSPCGGVQGGAPLDLSHATLRSISPMHIQYLRNMGTASTLVISIMVDGKLWGLISCQHRVPTALPLRLWQACHALSVAVGFLISWHASRQINALQLAASAAQQKILDSFNQPQISLPSAVSNCSDALLQIVHATGGAFWKDDLVVPFGIWPSDERSGDILRHVRLKFQHSTQDTYFTDSVVLQPPLTERELKSICGLAAIQLADGASCGIVWLRPELRQDVYWAGNPEKSVLSRTDANGQLVIMPRTSFALWLSTMAGKCKAWTNLDSEGVWYLLPLRQVILVIDTMTRLRLSEAVLQHALRDKEALIKEVHHRVKNNLQVVSSLMRMESRRSDSAGVKSVLGDMQSRIRSMSMLHEMLYRSETFASVDLGSYLRQLSTQALQAQSTSFGAVQLQLNLESVPVSMDQAVSCGLLVSELISNCLKHGFPGDATGHVSIDLLPLAAAQQWRLRVNDTGVGLPPDFEDRRKGALGLQLVTDLARQIGGALEIAPNQDRGAEFTVDFQVMAPAPLVMPA